LKPATAAAAAEFFNQTTTTTTMKAYAAAGHDMPIFISLGAFWAV